tara:strand:- start:594 stop:710 length:117 start_codon:yes stop_codon:yes gene_type:complete
VKPTGGSRCRGRGGIRERGEGVEGRCGAKGCKYREEGA